MWLFKKALWVWEIPKRRMERAQKRQREQLAEFEKEHKHQEHEKKKQKARIIKAITELRGRLDDVFGRSGRFSSENNTRMLQLKDALMHVGVVPENYRDAFNVMWKTRLEDVLSYIIQHGVEQGVVKYEQDLDRRVDGGDDDGARP